MIDKLKVRLMRDTTNDKYWYEELIGAIWIKIPSTLMSCEGNSRTSLKQYLQKRREDLYRIHVVQIGDEQEFSLLIDYM